MPPARPPEGAMPFSEGAPLPLRLLADDLTGALDSAAAFGPGVPVCLDHPGAEAADAAAPVSVVATATRDLPLAQLPDALALSVAWLASAGLAFKKVDSLLRGNTLHEVRLLAAAGGFERVVFAPALPAQGRYMQQERLWRAPAGAGLAQAQPVSPPLREACTAVVGWPAGCSLLVPDVDSDEALDAWAAQAVAGGGPRTLWCGSAGLAAAIARQLARRRPLAAPEALQAPANAAPAARGARGGAVWVVGASHQAVARRQWDRVQAAHPQALTVRHGAPAAWAAACRALALPSAHAQPTLVLLDLSPLAPLTALQAEQLLEAQVAQLAALPQPPARLLVLGGDTALALARATGVRQLRAGQPLRPGWGQAQWQGGAWDGLWMDCRSGAFGDDDDLLAALQACLAGPHQGGAEPDHALPPPDPG